MDGARQGLCPGCLAWAPETEVTGGAKDRAPPIETPNPLNYTSISILTFVFN